LVFGNINSFVGGMAGDYLGSGASASNGHLEVLAWRNMPAVIGSSIGCTRPAHISSARVIAFRLEAGFCMEVDGEPWHMPVDCDILIRPHRKVRMLRAPENARFWSRHIQPAFWETSP
jgi:hypothetical protein